MCAYNQAFMHVGSGYEQDMQRILMQIVTFSPQITQKQAPSQCYSIPINDISDLLRSYILLVHMVCLKFMWDTGKS